MLEWILVLYTVDTHQLVAELPNHYSTEQSCKLQRYNYMELGKTYAICQPRKTKGV